MCSVKTTCIISSPLKSFFLHDDLEKNSQRLFEAVYCSK